MVKTAKGQGKVAKVVKTASLLNTLLPQKHSGKSHIVIDAYEAGMVRIKRLVFY